MKGASLGGNLAKWQSGSSTKPGRAELSNLPGTEYGHDAVAFLLGIYVDDDFNGLKVFRVL